MSAAVWLTVFVCIAGGPSCKGLHPAAAPFPSFAECQAAGHRYEEAWLARHKDWREGGVVCSIARTTP
jgi:hypothetical protein